MKVRGFDITKPIIGVIYLAPSLEYDKHTSMQSLIDMANEDLAVLKRCGVDGALLENENDRPYTVLATPAMIATMSVVASKLGENLDDIKLGVEFLINDPHASLSVAKATGSTFIRTDYFVDKMSREEYGGEMKINPEELMQFKNKIRAQDVCLFADIQVKYAQMLEEGKSLGLSAKQAFENGCDGVIVSGKETGIAPRTADFLEARSLCDKVPLLIGSGLSLSNLDELFPVIDGAIVGTAFLSSNRMDYEKIAPFMDKVRQLRG